MTNKKISKKEAIVFGLQMTKKYFKSIFLLMLIFTAFNIYEVFLGQQAGPNIVNGGDMNEIFGDEKLSKSIYADLQNNGYFSSTGFRQEKLKNLGTLFELEIDPSFEDYRNQIYKFLETYRYQLPFPITIYYILCVLNWAVGILMSIGLIKISLDLARNQNLKISDLFTHKSLFISYILASICYGLAVMGGMLLLIVPGIIVSLMLQMYPYVLIDEKTGPIEALKKSRIITKGSRWQLFMFGCLCILFNLAGLLCLVVGLLFTVPASYIAIAYIYDKLIQSNEVQ